MAPNQRPFYIALGVVIVGGIVFIASKMIGAGNISIPVNVVVTTADTSGFHGYVLGSASAPVEITEYGDFQCPQCGNFDQVTLPDIKTRLIDAGKARLRFRDYPLDQIHSHTRIASHTAACADEQKHFWDVADMLFARQTEWGLPNSPSNPMPMFTEIVKSAGLDVGAWNECMKSAKYAGRIQASKNEGDAVGVTGTPTFVIGGRMYPNMGGDQMIKVVDSLIATMPAGVPGSTAPKPAIGGQ